MIIANLIIYIIILRFEKLCILKCQMLRACALIEVTNMVAVGFYWKIVRALRWRNNALFGINRVKMLSKSNSIRVC